MKIPTKIEKKLYVSMGLGRYNEGQIEVKDYYTRESTSAEGWETAFMFEFDLSIDIPEGITKDQLLNSLISKLKNDKSKMQASYHLQIKKIDERIQSFLAIEHKS